MNKLQSNGETVKLGRLIEKLVGLQERHGADAPVLFDGEGRLDGPFADDNRNVVFIHKEH
jgi:hypothetical protein